MVPTSTHSSATCLAHRGSQSSRTSYPNTARRLVGCFPAASLDVSSWADLPLVLDLILLLLLNSLLSGHAVLLDPSQHLQQKPDLPLLHRRLVLTRRNHRPSLAQGPRAARGLQQCLDLLVDADPQRPVPDQGFDPGDPVGREGVGYQEEGDLGEDERPSAGDVCPTQRSWIADGRLRSGQGLGGDHPCQRGGA